MMKAFDYIRRMFGKRRKKNATSHTITEGSLTITSGAHGIYFNQQSPVTFSSNHAWIAAKPDAVHQLVCQVAGKIDEKTLSDYEFREWLRDNLSSCEYQSETGLNKYVKAENTRPISVIDAMLEVKQ